MWLSTLCRPSIRGKPSVKEWPFFFSAILIRNVFLKLSQFFLHPNFNISLFKGGTETMHTGPQGPHPPCSGSSGPCPGGPYLVAHSQLSSWAFPDAENSQAVISPPSYKRVADLYNFVSHSQKSCVIKAEQFKNIEKEKETPKFSLPVLTFWYMSICCVSSMREYLFLIRVQWCHATNTIWEPCYSVQLTRRQRY